MTKEEAQIILDSEYRDTLERNREGIKNRNDMKDRYLKTLNEVKTWTPPTKDHENLKEFAIKQLTESIDFDCGTSYYENEVKKLDVDEWLKGQITRCKNSFDYHTRENEAEIKRTNERNQWVKDLRDSLKCESNTILV